MGSTAVMIGMMAVTAAAEAGNAMAQSAAAAERKKALDLQNKELQINTQQKTLANYGVLKKALSEQTAAMTVSGTSFSSPSFNAIQRDTWNKVAHAQKNNELEGDISLANNRIEKTNVQNTLYSQLFGDVAQVASTGASFYGSMPHTQTKAK